MNTQECADTRIVDPARLPFAYQDALNAGDADAVLALFHQDATISPAERRRLLPAGRPTGRGGSPSSTVKGQSDLAGGRSRFRRAVPRPAVVRTA